MSVATKLQSTAKPVSEPRAILGPAGNRVRVVEDSKRKSEVLKKAKQQQRSKKSAAAVASEMPPNTVKNNLSVESSSSTDSFSSGGSNRIVKRNGVRSVKLKIVPARGESAEISPKKEGPVKRCAWITPNSDPLYISFHDEEWGVPVRDDQKLFELLVFSQALAELSWPAILRMRDTFRKLFDNFDPTSIAQFTEKKLLTLKVNGNLLLSEPKLRAIVENAKQMIKVQQEFGSFSSYFWRFVNHKPLKNGFCYARQVPVKTPKAELISKDMMQRGFRCVGPTVIYSFMQVSGLVNDHLITCFRCNECEKSIETKTEETQIVTEALEKTKIIS